MRRAQSRPDDQVLSVLDERLDAASGEELTFAEWFARWDSGPRAVVVDRVALGRAGFGPKSLCIPSRPATKGRGISLETLEQHGLGMVMLESAIVITTATEVPGFDERKGLSAAVAEALLWGADRGDRFETVPRYRGESSPRPAALSGDDSVERLRTLEGWSTRRFTTPGWPGKEAFVYLVDSRAGVVAAWLIAAVLFFAWVWCRGWVARFSGRCLGLLVLLVAGLLLEWLLPACALPVTPAACSWGAC